MKRCRARASASTLSEVIFDRPKLLRQIAELEEKSAQPDFWNDPSSANRELQALSRLREVVTPFEKLRQSTKPVVSAVNGLCQGGGMQIALCSDMAVVSDRATFRVPELFRGIADTYYSQMLARMIGPAIKAAAMPPTA